MKKTIRVVGCIVAQDDTILMLYRSPSETDPSLWGIPAGKVDDGEDDLSAVTRELFEETGLMLDDDDLQFLGELSIEYEAITVIFPIYSVLLTKKPDIILDNEEHTDYRWLTVKQVLILPDLMKDVDKIIDEFCINKLGMAK